MATRIPEASRNGAVNGVVDLIDAGATAGYVEIRTGTQPADPDSVASGTLLATIPVGDPAFGNGAAGVATANAIAAVAASATGTAGWFRAYDSNANPVIDGSCTGTGGGGDMELNSTSLVSGVNVDITAWTVTMPDGT